MNKAQSLQFKVSCLGCSVCRALGYAGTPAELHFGRLNGLFNKKYRFVLGLCPEHHRGKTGIHFLGKKKFEAMHGLKVDHLVLETNFLINLLESKTKNETSSEIYQRLTIG